MGNIDKKLLKERIDSASPEELRAIADILKIQSDSKDAVDSIVNDEKSSFGIKIDSIQVPKGELMLNGKDVGTIEMYRNKNLLLIQIDGFTTPFYTVQNGNVAPSDASLHGFHGEDRTFIRSLTQFLNHSNKNMRWREISDEDWKMILASQKK